MNNKKCQSETEKVERGWISLGSDNGTLSFENESGEGSLRKLGNSHDLHFCCKTCFISYFFGQRF